MMPAILLDYKVSQPSNGAPGGVLPGDIPLPFDLSFADEVLVADIGLFLSSGAPNRVELSITVGFGHPQDDVLTMAISFLRDGDVIWTGLHDLGPVNTLESPELHVITSVGADFDVPEGFHVYQCTIAKVTSGVIRVNGPVTFCGAAYAMT